MTPAFRVTFEGLDVTSQIADRLLQLEVTDGEGTKSDRCSIVIDDRDARAQLPRKNARLQVWMGYRETGLSFMGTFKVSDVSTDGYPRRVSIQADAADMRGNLKQTRNHSYVNKTLGEIVREIAGRHGLSPRISGALANFRYPYLPQTGESDMNLLTTLAGRHDALFKIANDTLIFVARGEGLGGAIVVVGDLAGGGQVKRYSAKAQTRPEYGRVVAPHWDRLQALERRIQGIASSAPGAGLDLADMAATEHLITPRAPTEQEGQEQARARKAQQDRESGQLSIEIVGNPAAGADMTLVVTGVRPGSADGVWRIKTAKHSITSSGFTTDITAELPGKGNKSEGDSASTWTGGTPLPGSRPIGQGGIGHQ